MGILTSLFSPVSKQTNSNCEILSVDSYKKAISGKRVQLVDVRTAREYQAGHIEGAINIDFFDQVNFRSSFERFNKNEPLYIYCRSGNRSQKAARRLTDMGFTKIYDLAGGIMRWR